MVLGPDYLDLVLLAGCGTGRAPAPPATAVARRSETFFTTPGATRLSRRRTSLLIPRPWLGVALVVVAGCKVERPSGAPAGVALVPRLQSCTNTPTCEAQCRTGNAEACVSAADDDASGSGSARDDGRAVDLLDRGCALGSASACAFAGRLYESGHGVTQDLSRAFALYGQACDGGYMGGCYNSALLVEHGRGVVPDASTALALYRQVCRAGSEVACRETFRLESELTQQTSR